MEELEIIEDDFDDTFEICRGVSDCEGMKVVHGSLATGIPDRETAQLFAAAPALLDACEYVYNVLSGGNDSEYKRAECELKAAIAKARGEDHA